MTHSYGHGQDFFGYDNKKHLHDYPDINIIDKALTTIKMFTWEGLESIKEHLLSSVAKSIFSYAKQAYSLEGVEGVYLSDSIKSLGIVVLTKEVDIDLECALVRLESEIIRGTEVHVSIIPKTCCGRWNPLTEGMLLRKEEIR